MSAAAWQIEIEPSFTCLSPRIESQSQDLAARFHRLKEVFPKRIAYRAASTAANRSSVRAFISRSPRRVAWS